MDILQAIMLSIVEGITEFLPVSSTGHLILAADLLKIPDSEFLKSFEVIIQLGAILSVVSLYSGILLKRRDVWIKLIAAFFPAAAAGFVFYGIIKTNLLGNTQVVLGSLFTGGIILIIWEKIYQKKMGGNTAGGKGFGDLSLKDAFVVGVFQSVSIIPGVSRAAATIIGGMSVGLSRKAAIEFSFLLAIPTMAAATGLDLVKSNFQFSGYEWLVIAIGFAGAFVTALLTVKYFLRFVEHNIFVPFGIYRIVLSFLFWIFILR